MMVSGVVHSVGSVAGHRWLVEDTICNRLADCAPCLVTLEEECIRCTKGRNKVACRVHYRVRDEEEQEQNGWSRSMSNLGCPPPPGSPSEGKIWSVENTMS